MSDYIQHLLHFYGGIRELVQSLKIGADTGKRQSAKSFDDVISLAAAVTAGNLEIGSHVSARGWLSSYAYWYLPKGYSPYRFYSNYALSADGRQGVQMNSAPAFLPAGRIPFEREDLVLGFLYPTTAAGFTLELANPPEAQIPTPEVQMQSPDDHPWVYNMDVCFSNYSFNPERWIYSIGATEVFDEMSGNDKEASMMLTDPAQVRSVVEVPSRCKPIPVLYPRGYCRPNQYVDFSARIVELDSSILGELSNLGAPLAQKVYSLFSQPQTGIPAFCLSINGDNTGLVPRASLPYSGAPLPKLATLLVEFYFEAANGELLSFGDDELLELVIPSMKDQMYRLDDIYFPDRWLSKVYGFEGPVYMVKTGPIEMSISTTGAYCAYVTADLDTNLATMLPLLEQFVQHFQKSMLTLYPKRMGKQAVVRTTYLTDRDWQLGFGKLLDGPAFEAASRRSSQFYDLRKELQTATPTNIVNNYGSMVNSPIQQSTIDSSQSIVSSPAPEDPA